MPWRTEGISMGASELAATGMPGGEYDDYLSPPFPSFPPSPPPLPPSPPSLLPHLHPSEFSTRKRNRVILWAECH